MSPPRNHPRCAWQVRLWKGFVGKSGVRFMGKSRFHQTHRQIEILLDSWANRGFSGLTGESKFSWTHGQIEVSVDSWANRGISGLVGKSRFRWTHWQIEVSPSLHPEPGAALDGSRAWGKSKAHPHFEPSLYALSLRPDIISSMKILSLSEPLIRCSSGWQQGRGTLRVWRPRSRERGII